MFMIEEVQKPEMRDQIPLCKHLRSDDTALATFFEILDFKISLESFHGIIKTKRMLVVAEVYIIQCLEDKRA